MGNDRRRGTRFKYLAPPARAGSAGNRCHAVQVQSSRASTKHDRSARGQQDEGPGQGREAMPMSACVVYNETCPSSLHAASIASRQSPTARHDRRRQTCAQTCQFGMVKRRKTQPSPEGWCVSTCGPVPELLALAAAGLLSAWRRVATSLSTRQSRGRQLTDSADGASTCGSEPAPRLECRCAPVRPSHAVLKRANPWALRGATPPR